MITAIVAGLLAIRLGLFIGKAKRGNRNGIGIFPQGDGHKNFLAREEEAVTSRVKQNPANFIGREG